MSRPASRILITAPARTPSYLAAEIREAGFPVLEELPAGVLTVGTLADTMKLNLWIRTGHRVLWLLDEFEASDADEMYSRVVRIPWEEFLHEDGYVSVVSSIDTPSIDNTQFANVRCKDGIVDRMVQHCGRRPDSGPRTDRAVVFLYWKGRNCGIYLDTSGEPLSNRGYRRIPWRAPMRESLAAAVVLATRWDRERSFVNPMCGSGTLAIEAAMIALGRAPGLLRDNFGFMHLRGFDEALWKSLRSEARRAARRGSTGQIIASDINAEAVAAARRNAATAGVDHRIEFRVEDFRSTPFPEGGGVVMLNPEYGARLGELDALASVYEAIGDYLKQHAAGYFAYVFTGNPDLSRRIGLRTSRRIPFFNGPIDCRLLEYELYTGSRRHPRTAAA